MAQLVTEHGRNVGLPAIVDYYKVKEENWLGATYHFNIL